MNKRIGRTILATFIALSVAMLPIAASIIVSSKAAAASVTASVPDCVHHRDAPAGTSQKTTDGCDAMAGCALHCFNFTQVGFSTLALASSPSVAIEPIWLENKSASQLGSPPFRPPRS
jgi:ABC-type taurine transport system substrate-binding protein